MIGDATRVTPHHARVTIAPNRITIASRNVTFRHRVSEGRLTQCHSHVTQYLEYQRWYVTVSLRNATLA
jgi:hypothetical protein